MAAIGGLIERDFCLKPVVATEIEFYLHGAAAHFGPQKVLSLIEKHAAQAGISLLHVEAERGPDQYEVSLPYSHDVARIAADTERFKAAMAEFFLQADFSAKPLGTAPGSGLHVHVHLEDAQGRNVFFREGENYSAPLLHAVGGMLGLMNPCMPIFAPAEASYLRFQCTENSYLLCPTQANVPSTVSWGANNRTVAVRLPSKPACDKHVEHRVAGSDADVAKTIDAILAGIHYGLRERCDPGTPVYGDASLPQYALPKLVMHLQEAQRCMHECAALKNYPALYCVAVEPALQFISRRRGNS